MDRSFHQMGHVHQICLWGLLLPFAGVLGCQRPGGAPPFEWWVDPLPKPPPARMPEPFTTIVVLVEHTGRRDDFRQFQQKVSSQHDKVNRREIQGFRAECHYLPALADKTRSDLEAGLIAGGRFIVPERRVVDKALKEHRVQWLDLRTPATAAWLGNVCNAQQVLLVEITDVIMRVVEAGEQTLGAQKSGPVRRTDVTIRYDLRLVDAARQKMTWQSRLVRRCGYKLEGKGSMGHWYHPRDPLEFLQALRGQGVGEYVLDAFAGKPGDWKSVPVTPEEPWRDQQP